MRRARPPRICRFPSAPIRACVERRALNPALPSPRRAMIGLRGRPVRAAHTGSSRHPEIRRRSTCSTPLTDGGTDEEDDLHGNGAYWRPDGITGRWIARDEWPPEPIDDGV